jgi:hypothetical protein
VTAATKRFYDRLSQRLAASSQQRALKKIKNLLDYYATIRKDENTIAEEPFQAVLRASTENLNVIMLPTLAIVVSEFVFPLGILLGMLVFPFLYIVYNGIVSRREDTIYLSDLYLKTQKEVLELRAAVNDDVRFTTLWRSCFGEEPPFGKSTLELDDHEEAPATEPPAA